MEIHDTAISLLEQIGETVLLLDPADPEALAGLTDLLSALETALPEAFVPVGGIGAECRAAVEELSGAKSQEIPSILERIGELVLRMQQGTVVEKTRQSRVFCLPAWVDGVIFDEFIALGPTVLEEMESAILGAEQGDPEAMGNLRRRIHTLKGESGILGLSDVEHTCHVIEELLREDRIQSDVVDLMLSFKDWLTCAFSSYGNRCLPNVSPETLLEDASRLLRRDNPTVASLDSVAASLMPSSIFGAPLPSDDVAETNADPVLNADESEIWDDDTVGLAEEFLQESEEGLATVDEILLDIEDNGVVLEKVNALFRVFHTIKGVSGFLSLAEITKLAHATETLLNRAREEKLQMTSNVMDLLFSSTKEMRRMMDGVRKGVTRGRAPTAMPEIETLVSKMLDMAETDGTGQGKTSMPPAVATSTVDAFNDLEFERISSSEGQGASAPAGGGAATGKGKIREVVKVELERVDNLVGLIGELVIVESMVANSPIIASVATTEVRAQMNLLSKLTRDLQDISTRMRMVPVRGVFQKMARMVRDISRSNKKRIRTELSGEGTEMDRSMVEQIADPLVHMIRNAVDHGIETADERAEAGKCVESTVCLKAYHEGGNVVIELSDDGRGMNRDRILEKAIEKGLITERDVLSDSEIYNLVFLPGFSTAQQVTEISGRGVGMDVVRRNIESMRGKVRIDSVPGKGTTFHIILPLTLAIIDGMTVLCGKERYIIPSLSVLELIKPEPGMLFRSGGRHQVARIREEIIPLYRMDQLLHIPDAVVDPVDGLIILIENEGQKVGLVVDDVLAQQQVVIKGLGTGMGDMRYLSGSAILSDGRVGLILHTDELVKLSGTAVPAGKTGPVGPTNDSAVGVSCTGDAAMPAQ